MEAFSIGRTMSRASGLVRESLTSVGVFLLGVQAVAVLVQYLTMSQMRDMLLAARQWGNPAAGLVIFGSGWYWASLLLSLAVASLAYAGGISGMLKLAERGTVTIGECFSLGIGKVLPFFALSILASIAIVLGMVLLLVPGIILGLMWSVSLPAMAGENLGVLASLGRSRALTKGSRMMIFLTFLVVLVAIYIVIFAILGSLIGLSMTNMATQMAGSPVAVAFSLLNGWVALMVGNALMVSTYIETMLVKGEARSGHLDQVFA